MSERCEHPRVKVDAKAQRIRPKHDGGSLTLGYELVASVKCLECDEPFRFLGLPIGVSKDTATTNEGASELRAPMSPDVEPVYFKDLEGLEDAEANDLN